MEALIWHAARDLRLESVDEPAPPGRGEVVVEVAYCGICGTDLHEYVDGPVMIRPQPHPLTGEAPPLALGHEFSGRIAAIGADVGGLALGERVTVDPCWRCGTCFWCRRGQYNICERGGSIGLASSGALGQFVRAQAAGVVRLPDEVDDQMAALAEPLAVGYHAVARGGVRSGDRVLVIGFGPIGGTVVLAAAAAGASDIFVSEPDPRRRDMALRLGATEALDPDGVDVRRETFLRTGRVGPDVVFECTGVPALIAAGLDTVRRGGRLVSVSTTHGTAAIDSRKLVLYEREIVGSLGYNHDLEIVVRLMAAGILDPRPLITGVVPLQDAITDGFDALLERREPHLKLLVDVGGR